MQDSIVPQKAKRSHTKQAHILSLLKKFNSQDKLTITQFCRKQKIHRPNFYTWQKRHGKKDEGLDNVKGFVSVKVTAPVSSPGLSEDPMLFAEVNGIRLYHFVPADYLKALIS